MVQQLTIRGEAHFSARGDLESEMWNWGLDINGEYATGEDYLKMRTPRAREFYDNIKDYLPKLSPNNPCFDGGIPGGEWIFLMPLEKMKEPEKVKSILMEYFPGQFG